MHTLRVKEGSWLAENYAGKTTCEVGRDLLCSSLFLLFALTVVGAVIYGIFCILQWLFEDFSTNILFFLEIVGILFLFAIGFVLAVLAIFGLAYLIKKLTGRSQRMTEFYQDQVTPTLSTVSKKYSEGNKDKFIKLHAVLLAFLGSLTFNCLPLLLSDISETSTTTIAFKLMLGIPEFTLIFYILLWLLYTPFKSLLALFQKRYSGSKMEQVISFLSQIWQDTYNGVCHKIEIEQ